VIVKPDGVRRGLVGEVLRRLERAGLRIVGLKMLHLSRPLAESLYAQHRGKGFFEPLIEFMTSGPIVAICVEGNNAVSRVRALIGPTNPAEAPKGTIRGDFGSNIRENVVHAADSLQHAQREIALLFREEELIS